MKVTGSCEVQSLRLSHCEEPRKKIGSRLRLPGRPSLEETRRPERRCSIRGPAKVACLANANARARLKGRGAATAKVTARGRVRVWVRARARVMVADRALYLTIRPDFI